MTLVMVKRAGTGPQQDRRLTIQMNGKAENGHEVTIRVADEADGEAIGILAVQLLQHEHSLYPEMGQPTPWAGSAAEIRKQLDQPGTRFFIASRGGTVVGYVKVVVHGKGTGGNHWRRWLRRAFDLVTGRPRPNVQTVGGLIPGIFVSPAERGAGVGRRLLEAAEAWLCAEGMTSFNIHVLQNNTTALRFWEEQGYEPVMIGMRKRAAP